MGQGSPGQVIPGHQGASQPLTPLAFCCPPRAEVMGKGSHTRWRTWQVAPPHPLSLSLQTCEGGRNSVRIKCSLNEKGNKERQRDSGVPAFLLSPKHGLQSPGSPSPRALTRPQAKHPGSFPSKQDPKVPSHLSSSLAEQPLPSALRGGTSLSVGDWWTEKAGSREKGLLLVPEEGSLLIIMSLDAKAKQIR